jgi:flagellar hook-length control protein FliK
MNGISTASRETANPSLRGEEEFFSVHRLAPACDLGKFPTIYACRLPHVVPAHRLLCRHQPLIHRREICMNPVTVPASPSSSLPVAGAHAKGNNGPASLLEALLNTDGQPNFSAMLDLLVGGALSSGTVVPQTIGVAPSQAGVAPLPNLSTTQKNAGKTKTGDATAIDPATAIAANLLPTPVPPITNGGLQLPKVSSATTAIHGATPNAVPLAANVPGSGQNVAATLDGSASNTGRAPSAPDEKQALEGVPHPPQLPPISAKPGATLADQEVSAVSPSGSHPTAAALSELIASAALTTVRGSDREPPATKDPPVPVGATASAALTPHAIPVAPAPPQPMTPVATQIHDQIAGHLDQLQQQGRVELQLNLHPPELGRVQLHLTLEDGHLNVRMVVQDESAKRMIDQHLEPLRVRFAEMGVSVGQFDVRRDGSSSNPERQPAAEPSVQALQAGATPTWRLQKTYGNVAKSTALVDVIA